MNKSIRDIWLVYLSGTHVYIPRNPNTGLRSTKAIVGQAIQSMAEEIKA